MFGALLAWFVCYAFSLNPFGGVHSRAVFKGWDSTYFHDSVVTVLLRHDTVRVPYALREQVLADRADDAPCPVISYASETATDTIRIIADCERAIFPLIDVRHAPIIVERIDTLTLLRAYTDTVKKTVRPFFTADVFTEGLTGQFATGIEANLSLFSNISAYARGQYRNKLEAVIGVKYNILTW